MRDDAEMEVHFAQHIYKNVEIGVDRMELEF
jgi:hypothetical protein